MEPETDESVSRIQLLLVGGSLSSSPSAAEESNSDLDSELVDPNKIRGIRRRRIWVKGKAPGMGG